VSAFITEEDRAVAWAFRSSGLAGWMDGVQTERWLIEKLAQLVADARERENQGCYEDVSEIPCRMHGDREDGCPCLAQAEQAIAARRSR
jgi:hypothetical protein